MRSKRVTQPTAVVVAAVVLTLLSSALAQERQPVEGTAARAASQPQEDGGAPSPLVAGASSSAAGCPSAGCSGRGDCIKGICVCRRPFTGIGCEEEGDLSASAEAIGAVGGFPEPPDLPIEVLSGPPASSEGGAESVPGAIRVQSSSPAAPAAVAAAPVTLTGDGGGGVPAPRPPPLTVCLVTAEVVGPVSNGGIGTAMTTLAHTLTAAGHAVTILFTLGAASQYGPFESWVDKYRADGIELVGLWRPALRYIPRHLLESYEVLKP